MKLIFTKEFLRNLFTFRWPSVFKEIKWFIQRGRRGYSDVDTLNINSYLCNIIPLMVRSIKENHLGCPGDVFDAKRVNDECWKWNIILEEIAQGFEAGKDIGDSNYFKVKKYKDIGYEHIIDKKRQAQLTKKYDRGMELFVKHFWGLWD